MQSFADRREAGVQLGAELTKRAALLQGPAPMVLGLPRGGMPVAAEVAAALSAPLDVLLVRKLGTPGQPELAMGAIGEDGVVVTNPWIASGYAAIDPDVLQAVVERERVALAERSVRYRAVRAPLSIAGSTAVVVDDGIATGATARAACAVARIRGAATVLVAAPVIARSTVTELTTADPVVADQVIALLSPADFGGVGQFYRDFSATLDDEVIEILRAAR